MDVTPNQVETREIVRLPDRETARMQLSRVEDFKRVVRELFIDGHDFGVIPGTGDKPTLLKPGAEKLIKLLALSDQYEFIDKIEEWERGFFNYTIKCKLVSLETGVIVAEGIGNCNSWESKYRYRWAWASEMPEADRPGKRTRTVNTRQGRSTQYRVENDDIASQVNTILKMAKKRAQMDAALSAGRLSDVFTQDLEEIAENRRAAQGDPAEVAHEPAPHAPQEGVGAAAPNGEPQKSPMRTGLESAWGVAWNRASKLGLKDNTKISGLSDAQLQEAYNALNERIQERKKLNEANEAGEASALI